MVTTDDIRSLMFGLVYCQWTQVADCLAEALHVRMTRLIERRKA